MSNPNSEELKNPQKRVAYNRKHVGVSRTGGVAATKTFRRDGAGATLNTKQGLCLHTRLFQGAQMGFKTEIFNVLEATIVVLLTLIFPKEVSVVRFKIKEGHNLFKPNYSSFKFGGIQLRGKNAATFQWVYMLVILCVNTIKIF